MNNKVLYESILSAISKEIKKVLYEAKTDNFNNGEAYRFLKIYVAKVIIMTLGEKNAKLDNSTDSVKMKLKIGKTTKDVHLSMCYNDKNEVAVSQSKMMWMKNIAFISDNKIYIVNGDLLRANWGNEDVCRIDRSVYFDRLKESSKMTRFNLDFLKTNASDIISLTEEAAEKYQTSYNEMNLK